MAVGVALLMIGGEFDLSTGVAVITSALIASMFSCQFTMNVWVGVVVVAGGVAGHRVHQRLPAGQDRLPSFIVTLGTFLMLTGLNLGVTRLITGNVGTHDSSDMDGFASAQAVFASEFNIGGVDVKITVFCWIALRRHRHLGAAAHPRRQLDLRRRRRRGQLARGRRPGQRTKIGLFMAVGFCAGSPACTSCSPSTPCSPARAWATSSSTSSPR